MHLYYTEEIWKQFPQLVPGIIVIEKVNPNVDPESKLSSWFQLAIDRLEQGPESQWPEIAAWRQAYSKMGLKPSFQLGVFYQSFRAKWYPLLPRLN